MRAIPGRPFFGAHGGLTCFVTSENTRPVIFEAIRRRHTYGTTGPRVFLDVSADLPEGGTLFLRNPDAMPDTETEQVDHCTLGDIVRSNGDTAQVSVAVKSPIGIVSAELRDGIRMLHRERTYGADDLGLRIRLMWSGAEYRGRGRNTAWHGRATLTDARIDALEPGNKLNPEMRMQQPDPQQSFGMV